MKEKKGKIFNQQEVRAIIAGKKTMFREVVKPLKHESLVDCVLKGQIMAEDSKKVKGFQVYFQKPKNKWFAEDKPTGIIVKSKFQVGETIFVKESFSKLLIHSGHQYYYPAHCIRECVDRDNGFHYWADGNPEFGDWESPRSATNMKQEQSRITLRIKSVKVERLQDISNDDAIAEAPQYSVIQPFGNKNPIDFFRTLWQSTHKKQEHKWEANPWVFVYEFEVINN